jgi:hypothetical protein
MALRDVRRPGVVSLSLVAVALLVAGCSGSDAESGGDGGSGDALQAERFSLETGGDGGGGGSHRAAAQGLTTDESAVAYDSTSDRADIPDTYVAATRERVIKTADLSLEVPDGELGEALKEGREIAEAAGGFLLSTSISGRDRAHGAFVIRVPADRFEETLSALEDLGKVTAEDVKGQDVSQEFVDLEARLRNATAQEEVLFELYDRSQSIADTIRVQRELEDVQLEIEQLRGRLRYLEDRTDLSTISVTVTESGAVVAEAGPFDKAWRTARRTFVAVVSGAIVGAGFLLPLVLFALVLYGVFRLVRPRLQRATP